MRIWHEKLIPMLCRQHLLAVWREALGAYSIIIEGKKGYRNHPATIEFARHPNKLWLRLYAIREEMLKRGYKPKPMPTMPMCPDVSPEVTEWQSIDEQIRILKIKGCDCIIDMNKI